MWKMEARERDQCSRGARVDNPSRALPHAFSNERMVRAGTRRGMYDGWCSHCRGEHLDICARPEGRKTTRCSASSTNFDEGVIENEKRRC